MINVRTALALSIAACLASSAASAMTVYPVESTAGLVAAINAANLTPEADIITLERGLYVLDAVNAGDQAAAMPEITSPIVIRGNGAELRRYSNADFRIFHVAETGHLKLEQIVLAEGSMGAIRNHGTTELRNVALVDSTARGASAIVENYGEMRLNHCEVSFNTVAGASRDAGTIINWGKLWLTATTFQGNQLTRRYEGVALASSVLNYGTAEIEDVVIAENVAGEPDTVGAPQAPLVNLGNGRLELRLVREHDNLPGEALVAKAIAP
ncbi:MAG: hypothetical protein AB7E72_17155 [Lysobacterales bacterium]